MGESGMSRQLDFATIRALVELAAANALTEVDIREPTYRIRCVFTPRLSRSPTPPKSGRRKPLGLELMPYSEELRLAELYEEGKLKIVRSPAVGFWAVANVTIGDPVASDTVLGRINVVGIDVAIAAESAGVLASIYLDPGEPVQYGQILAAIRF
jgi:biotin carboxyl carrier protein